MTYRYITFFFTDHFCFLNHFQATFYVQWAKVFQPNTLIVLKNCISLNELRCKLSKCQWLHNIVVGF